MVKKKKMWTNKPNTQFHTNIGMYCYLFTIKYKVMKCKLLAFHVLSKYYTYQIIEKIWFSCQRYINSKSIFLIFFPKKNQKNKMKDSHMIFEPILEKNYFTPSKNM